MANSKQAKKRDRQESTKRSANKVQRNRMRTMMKNLSSEIDSGNTEAAVTLYPNVSKILDQSSSKGLIPKNRAARLKSNFNTRIKELATA